MHIISSGYTFEWSRHKEKLNVIKHGFGFEEAREVFKDPYVTHLEDCKHSKNEDRHYAIGKTSRGVVLTVRYTKRGNVVWIFGAASWRKWRRFYEKRKNTRSV